MSQAPVPEEFILCARGPLSARHLERAVEHLLEAQAQGLEDPIPLLELTRILFCSCAWDLASAYLERARKLAPEHHRTLALSGVLCEVRGDLDAAGDYLRRAVEKNSSSLLAQLNAGRVHGLRGDLRAARRNLSHVISISSSHPLGNLYLSLCLAGSGAMEQAYRKLVEVLAWNPLLPLVYSRLADMLEQLDETRSAEMLVKQGISLLPTNAHLLRRAARYSK